MASTTEYMVTGMTCQHCVDAVAKEVGGIDGVTGVDVDLDSGRVSVSSEQPVDAAAVLAAVNEAGYELAG